MKRLKSTILSGAGVLLLASVACENGRETREERREEIREENDEVFQEGRGGVFEDDEEVIEERGGVLDENENLGEIE